MPEFDMPLGLGTAAIIATDKTRITELAIRTTCSACHDDPAISQARWPISSGISLRCLNPPSPLEVG